MKAKIQEEAYNVHIFQVSIEVEFIDQVSNPSPKSVWQLQTSVHIAII